MLIENKSRKQWKLLRRLVILCVWHNCIQSNWKFYSILKLPLLFTMFLYTGDEPIS